MSGSNINPVKFYGTIAAMLLVLFARSLHALPNTIFSNEVYPLDVLPSKVSPFSLAVTRNMSAVTDLREFIMKYVEDERICHSKSIRDIIFSEGEDDRAASTWWAKRCGRRSSSYKRGPDPLQESTLIRYRRNGAKRASSQQSPSISQEDQKKLNDLLKNKKIQCNPKKAVVELPQKNGLVMYKPSCVYIKQCGGCCDSDLLECRPTKEKMRKFKVLALEKTVDKAGAVKFQGGHTLEAVIVSEHKKCQCECKVREENCTANQLYDADGCRCYCDPNINRTCGPGKVWSDTQCNCVCNSESACTTGRYFSENSCRCEDPQY